MTDTTPLSQPDRGAAPQVLIVGAGPVGLTAAAFLARQGVSFDLVDKREGPDLYSRALGVHARSLEFMSMLGLDGRFLDEGLATRYMSFHNRDRHLFSLDFATLRGRSKYPFYLILPQSQTERILTDHLAERGVSVAWRTTLTGLDQRPDGLVATLTDPQGRTVTREYAYAIGADGATSTVRSLLGIEFEGATYPASFLLSEVKIPEGHIRRDSTHVFLGDATTVAVIPLPDGSYRVVGPDFSKPPAQGSASNASDLEFADFAAFLRKHNLLTGVPMTDPSRLVAYRMHKRVAARFNVGRVFLAGDAAHIHSPAGGQGMNTGMHDAVNLSWKIAAVLDGGAPAGLLDTYERERRTFARMVVADTDRAMTRVMSRSPLNSLYFNVLAPLALAAYQPTEMIAAMAQITGSYEGSLPFADLSDGHGPAPGVRFADLALDRGGSANGALGHSRPTMFLSGDAAETRALERLVEDWAPGRAPVVRRLAVPLERPRRMGLGHRRFIGGVFCRPDGYVLTSVGAAAVHTARPQLAAIERLGA